MSVSFQLRRLLFWDLFFPPICALCDRSLERDDILFCGHCLDACEIAHAVDLPPFRQVDRPHAAFLMHHHPNDPVRALVHALKYDGHRVLAGRMAQRWSLTIPKDLREQDAVWVPVPQYWARGWQRGFSQSALLARALQKELGFLLELKLLRRIRHTRSQVHLTPPQRRENVRNAFRISKGCEIPERVILLDDVTTTGATMEECARTLKKAGVTWVGAVAFARAKP